MTIFPFIEGKFKCVSLDRAGWHFSFPIFLLFLIVLFYTLLSALGELTMLNTNITVLDKGFAIKFLEYSFLNSALSWDSSAQFLIDLHGTPKENTFLKRYGKQCHSSFVGIKLVHY